MALITDNCDKQLAPCYKIKHELSAKDLKELLPTGESIMALTDYCSRYPVASILIPTNTSYIIDKLEVCFTIFGYPHEIITDKGP